MHNPMLDNLIEKLSTDTPPNILQQQLNDIFQLLEQLPKEKSIKYKEHLNSFSFNIKLHISHLNDQKLALKKQIAKTYISSKAQLAYLTASSYNKI